MASFGSFLLLFHTWNTATRNAISLRIDTLTSKPERNIAVKIWIIVMSQFFAAHTSEILLVPPDHMRSNDQQVYEVPVARYYAPIKIAAKSTRVKSKIHIRQDFRAPASTQCAVYGVFHVHGQLDLPSDNRQVSNHDARMLDQSLILKITRIYSWRRGYLSTYRITGSYNFTDTALHYVMKPSCFSHNNQSILNWIWCPCHTYDMVLSYRQ